MYRGEVTICNDRLDQFVEAAKFLQLNVLMDGSGEHGSIKVSRMSQQQHEPAPVEKTAAQARSLLELPTQSTSELNVSDISFLRF